MNCFICSSTNDGAELRSMMATTKTTARLRTLQDCSSCPPADNDLCFLSPATINNRANGHNVLTARQSDTLFPVLSLDSALPVHSSDSAAGMAASALKPDVASSVVASTEGETNCAGRRARDGKTKKKVRWCDDTVPRRRHRSSHRSETRSSSPNVDEVDQVVPQMLPSQSGDGLRKTRTSSRSWSVPRSGIYTRRPRPATDVVSTFGTPNPVSASLVITTHRSIEERRSVNLKYRCVGVVSNGEVRRFERSTAGEADVSDLECVDVMEVSDCRSGASGVADLKDRTADGGCGRSRRQLMVMQWLQGTVSTPSVCAADGGRCASDW